MYNSHQRRFEYIASCLNGYTKRCIISFVDMYRKTKRNTKALNMYDISHEQMLDIAGVIEITSGCGWSSNLL